MNCRFWKQRVRGKESGIEYTIKRIPGNPNKYYMWLADTDFSRGTITKKRLQKLYELVACYCHPCNSCNPCISSQYCTANKKSEHWIATHEQFELGKQFVHHSRLTYILKIVDTGTQVQYRMSDSIYLYTRTELLQDYIPVVSVQEL